MGVLCESTGIFYIAKRCVGHLSDITHVIKETCRISGFVEQLKDNDNNCVQHKLRSLTL